MSRRLRFRLPVFARTRRCCNLPSCGVTRDASCQLPRSWAPIDQHPHVRPGAWVPCGEFQGVVFCERCGAFWYLFLDPGLHYYTDVIELSPELEPILCEDAALEDVLRIAVTGDAMLHLMIRDWFALADYDPQAAAQALVDQLGAPNLHTSRAVRLLDCLLAILTSAKTKRVVKLAKAAPLAGVLDRRDLTGLDPVRYASEFAEMRRLVAEIARAGFGAAFGRDRDRLSTSRAVREDLLERASEAGLGVAASPRARAGTGSEHRRLECVERLVIELEEFLGDRPTRVTAQEIAPVLEVVRSFWTLGPGDSDLAPIGLALYRRCRDLLFALRSADLVPVESEMDVAAALVVSA